MAVDRSWLAHERDVRWTSPPADGRVLGFHRTLPGYAPTRLVELPAVAAELGVGRVAAKDESQRLGLPAFKALGASWAMHRALEDSSAEGPATFVTATDGNHGRAVARLARQFGHGAIVVVPTGVHPAAVEAIAGEDADVRRVDGSYDDAVAEAAAIAEREQAILLQDTAWAGYAEVPSWIVDGYETMLVELDEQLAGVPDLVAVPTGVGSLLQAVLAHYRRRSGRGAPAVVAVEPDSAACVHASLAAGHPVTVPTSRTTMAGLNCGTVSAIAWPVIERALDAALLTSDADAERAARDLAAQGVAAGPCGAAPLAALRAALGAPDGDELRRHLGLDGSSTVVLLVTEGAEANPFGGS